MSPHLNKPEHLRSIIDILESPDPFRLLLSAPPRHGKSYLLFHYIAWYLVRNPTHSVLYCSYAAKIAATRSKDIRQIAIKAGLELDRNTQSAEMWRTKAGGGLHAVGPEGGVTGFGFNLIVVDDALRNRTEAESPIIRENIYSWWTSTTRSRLEPGGKIAVSHTRWHPDDLIGRLCQNPNYTYINLPAINGEGQALWPERWNVSALLELRGETSEYDWASLYQGQPRPRGGAVFRDTQCYTTEPNIIRKAGGLDLAYTAKTYSDWSVLVVLGQDVERNIYVLDVIRKQCEPADFIKELKKYPLRYRWYLSGVEKGIVSLLQRSKVYIDAQTAISDKFVRAQPVAKAWNEGKIFVPASAPWVDLFTNEVLGFTGVGDAHDDQVDALAAAYDALTKKRVEKRIGEKPVVPY